MGLVLLIRDIYSRTLELARMQRNAKNVQKERFFSLSLSRRNATKAKARTQQKWKTTTMTTAATLKNNEAMPTLHYTYIRTGSKH